MSRLAGHPVVRDQCLAPGRADGAPTDGDRYRPMFETLAPLEADEASLHALGAGGSGGLELRRPQQDQLMFAITRSPHG